ncbi:PNO [Symbiodinium necroappetens]|uniref:PNO protein n=1 Tax=Symbiodinium necroappetens TaxID=1628268 RepID=A0A813BPE2_9DINO|nr:PNO [Symbiodinium necroappetens]
MTPRGRRFVKQQLPNGDGNDFDTGLHKLPGPTPLLQMNAGRCTIIVIFLRCWHLGGTVDPHPMVDEPLQKARHIFLNPDNPLERLKYVGTELTSMGRYQQDTRARFLDAITVLHGSASGNAEELAKSLMRDLIALGLQSIVRMLDDFVQKTVIFVVSTCGLGAYPASCKQTRLKLQSPDLPWLGLAAFSAWATPLTTSSAWPLPASASPCGLAKPPLAMLTSSHPVPTDSRYNMLTGDGKYDRDMRHYEFKIEGTNVAHKTGERLKDKALVFFSKGLLDFLHLYIALQLVRFPFGSDAS